MAKLTRAQKQEEVVKLADQFGRAKAAVFAVYRGLSVREMTELRKMMREQGIEFKVVKTSLVRRALNEVKLPLPAENVFAQPVAVAFSYEDEILPAKLLAQAAKSAERLSIVAGIIGGALVDRSYLQRLASLPSREELVARMIGTLSNLPRRLVGSLQYPVSSFTTIMKQYQSQLGG